MHKPIKGLEKDIGYEFKDISLFETALTHSSYLNEHRGEKSYERLEFLGDSVLGLLTADMLFRNYGEMPEGELTRQKSMLVCEPSLANAAAKLKIGEYCRLGKGEDNPKGRSRPSILADMVESTLAAIYLDGGIDAAAHFAVVHIFPAADRDAVTDYKSALQERVQSRGAESVVYTLVGERGPDHDKTFSVEVSLKGEVLGSGTGGSKKEAEQMAAKTALQKI